MEYFGRLSNMWEEPETAKPIPVCSCDVVALFEQIREEEKLHQFIMGLDESRFDHICTRIIDKDSLPDLNEAYPKAVREENILSSSKDQQQQAVGFTAKCDPNTKVTGCVAQRN